MADSNITGLSGAVTSATLVDADLLAVDDTSASAETKNITAGDVAASAPWADRYEQITGEFDVNVVAASGSTETLTLAAAHRVTLDQACTISFTTPVQDAHLMVVHTFGTYAITWPAAVTWRGDTPTVTGECLWAFETSDQGTTWLGVQVGSGYA